MRAKTVRTTAISTREIQKGDRLLLQQLDNTRYLAEVTSVHSGSISARSLGPDGLPLGRVRRIKVWEILCLEGEVPIKHAGNLIPDDLIYDPSHRSGLQYAKAVLVQGDHTGIIRWDEARRAWTKRPTSPTSYRIEFLGRADSAEELSAFLSG